RRREAPTQSPVIMATYQGGSMRSQPLIVLAMMLISGSWQPAWATDYIQTALRFRDSATAVYQQGVDVCGGECEPELSGPIADLGSSLPSLNDAIATGDPPTINNAVSNTASTLRPLCNVLHVDCSSPPSPPLGSRVRPRALPIAPPAPRPRTAVTFATRASNSPIPSASMPSTSTYTAASMRLSAIMEA